MIIIVFDNIKILAEWWGAKNQNKQLLAVLLIIMHCYRQYLAEHSN
jgi:hypothetical protein